MSARDTFHEVIHLTNRKYHLTPTGYLDDTLIFDIKVKATAGCLLDTSSYSIHINYFSKTHNPKNLLLVKQPLQLAHH